MSHSTLACGDPYLKKFYLADDGATVPLVIECQRVSGHTGYHAALWITRPVTWFRSDV